ncbi:MAG: glycoside hydrolase family 13 protein [Bacteroidales bacterium]|nr:glycoside hydrolase family 13 protein [Bacteroidales bacterium]
MKLLTSFTLLILVSLDLGSQTKDPLHATPDWAKNVIWYQIFVERFRNGDPSNDPTPETMHVSSNFEDIPSNWAITPWTSDWYKPDDWATELTSDFYGQLQLRRYGGDLQGVIDKIDYLADLGITAVYFNPLNDAPSLHKYDARNYRHIDVNFGPDPEGDLKQIMAEDPADPATWQWTSADLMFLQLVEALHQKGIRVILDYSWNHTGVDFWAWKDVVKNQEASAYAKWYEIKHFDNPGTEKNEFEYSGWIGISSLPELRKVDTRVQHSSGIPYEGDLDPKAKAHIFEVSRRWLAPMGDTSRGIDGFRLDVADHVPMGFWRDYRKFVRSINPQAYLVGELWWKQFPDHLMDPSPYLKGDVFDAAMFYQVYRPARYFFANTDYEITADQLVDSLTYQWSRLRPEVIQVMMNTASTHDSPRLLSSFGNRGKYKYRAKPNDDPAYITAKPSAETYQRLKLYLLFQFTIPGNPHIWNGEEMGMWGADDPDCRKPLWWPDLSFEPERTSNIRSQIAGYDTVGFNQEMHKYYKQLISLRKTARSLATADISFVLAEDKKLVYLRGNQNEKVLVAFNLSDEVMTYTIPLVKKKTVLFGDVKSLVRDEIILEPLQAVAVQLEGEYD